MFSITVFVLIYGIISICAQECKDVRMKMSSAKPGRVELDIDQFCRCAGYSRTATADEAEYSKWKKPTTESDESYTETIDKNPITMKTTNSINTRSTDKPESYEKSTLTSDIALEKKVVLTEDKTSTHYIDDITSTILSTKKTTASEIADDGVLATESTKDISMRESVEDKTTLEKTSTPSTTEKYKGIVTKSNSTGFIYAVATTVVTEKFTSITTEKIVDKSIYENSTHEFIDKSTISTIEDSDITTEESTKTHETDEIAKSPTTLTSKKITDISTTVKATDKITTRKPSLDSTTDVPINKTNTSITEESVVKGIEDSTTKTSETIVVTYVPYHSSGMPHTTTEEDYKYEKKAENSSEAAPEKSHMTEESDYGLQIFLLLLCIIVCSIFILAVIYTVYMSHRSNSYVLPTAEDTTPLNQI